MSKYFFRLHHGLESLIKEKKQVDLRIAKLTSIIRLIEKDLHEAQELGQTFVQLVKNGWRSHGYKYFHYEALKDQREAYAHVSLCIDRRIKMVRYEINRPRKEGGAK